MTRAEHYSLLHRSHLRAAPPTPTRADAAEGGAATLQASGGAQTEAPQEWVYRDPQGELQGPFSQEDIIDW